MSNERFVLDASALMCLFRAEKGAEVVLGILKQAAIGTVNLSEVVSKLQEQGASDKDLEDTLNDLEIEIVDFDANLAIKAGKLRGSTRSKGLSLGDRACMALAAERDAVAVTTDRAWQEFEQISRVLLVR